MSTQCETFRKFLTLSEPEPKTGGISASHSPQEKILQTNGTDGKRMESFTANQCCQWKMYTPQVCLLAVSTHQMSGIPNGEKPKNLVPEIHFVDTV